jgi:hypothetical protein
VADFTQLENELTASWITALRATRAKDQLLYHYTGAEGALGILRSCVLRGTSAGYLNDTSEISYGLSVCESVIAQEMAACGDSNNRRLLETIREGVRSPEMPFEVYVTSFSEAADDLNQWRAYSPADVGYALGFALERFSERDVFRFPQRVDYDRRSQEAQVSSAVRSTLAFLDDSERKQEFWRASPILLFHLRRIACTFKHAGFAGEREWRSVTTMKDEDRPFIELQVVRGLLKPYAPMLAGSRESNRLPVVELRVGYSASETKAVHGARLLLDRYGYGDAHVVLTQIPYTR